MNDRKRLNRLALDKLYASRVLKKSMSIILDESHPDNDSFELLRTDQQYVSIRTDSNRHLNSFYPSVVRLLNH